MRRFMKWSSVSLNEKNQSPRLSSKIFEQHMMKIKFKKKLAHCMNEPNNNKRAGW